MERTLITTRGPVHSSPSSAVGKRPVPLRPLHYYHSKPCGIPNPNGVRGRRRGRGGCGREDDDLRDVRAERARKLWRLKACAVAAAHHGNFPILRNYWRGMNGVVRPYV